MERAMWIHQLDQLGERTPEQIAATLLPRGISRIYLKAMDGGWWMSEVYDHPLAPAGTDQLERVAAQFSAAGLQLVPWVVSRWSAREADAHLACARAGGGLVVDFEYGYTGFWEGGPVEAQRYFEALRAAAAPGLWIAVAPDPRQVGREYAPALIAGLSAYLPQTYWTDFRQPWLDVLQTAASRCEPLGPTEPILPYDAVADDLRAGLVWCEERGYQSVSLWRMGAANASQLDAFGVPPAPAAPDAPAPADDAIPAMYVERGWTTWPAVAVNLEGIIHQLLAERDALLRGAPRGG